MTNFVMIDDHCTLICLGTWLEFGMFEKIYTFELPSFSFPTILALVCTQK